MVPLRQKSPPLDQGRESFPRYHPTLVELSPTPAQGTLSGASRPRPIQARHWPFGLAAPGRVPKLRTVDSHHPSTLCGTARPGTAPLRRMYVDCREYSTRTSRKSIAKAARRLRDSAFPGDTGRPATHLRIPGPPVSPITTDHSITIASHVCLARLHEAARS
jgi:hypothetical protein